MNYTIAISKLQIGTKFKYDGCEYELAGGSSATTLLKENEEYIGERVESAMLQSCYPKLGGKFQKNVTVWISRNTKVNF